MVEQAGLPQPALVRTRPPLAAVFVGEVRYPREPAGAAAAREDALCAAEWPCGSERALASDLARFCRGRPLGGHDRDADQRRARAGRWLRTGREKGARSDASPAGSRGAIYQGAVRRSAHLGALVTPTNLVCRSVCRAGRSVDRRPETYLDHKGQAYRALLIKNADSW